MMIPIRHNQLAYLKCPYASFQVAEKVRIFVTDANDESPEFLNTPYIIQVPEVGDTSFSLLIKSGWRAD